MITFREPSLLSYFDVMSLANKYKSTECFATISFPLSPMRNRLSPSSPSSSPQAPTKANQLASGKRRNRSINLTTPSLYQGKSSDTQPAGPQVISASSQVSPSATRKVYLASLLICTPDQLYFNFASTSHSWLWPTLSSSGIADGWMTSLTQILR